MSDREPTTYEQKLLKAILEEVRLIRQALEKPAATVSEAPRKRKPRRKKEDTTHALSG